MTLLAASSGPSAYWYLTRSSGATALVLLSLTVAAGVLDVERLSSTRWPRFLLDAIHRNLALLTLAFLALHIITSVLDSFAPISIVAAVIPFTSSYRPFWLGLGALAFDLLLAVAITSWLRRRIGHVAWRNVHWLAYASWPVALLHGFGTGSDVKSGWLLALSIVCLALVIAAVIWRAARGWPQGRRIRGAALAASGGLVLFLLLWLPAGPLGSEWARRSGTPSTLLPGTSTHKGQSK